MKKLSLVTLTCKVTDSQIVKEAVLVEEGKALFLEEFLYLLFIHSNFVSIPISNETTLEYRDIVDLCSDLAIEPVTNYFQSWKKSYESTKIGAISYFNE